MAPDQSQCKHNDIRTYDGLRCCLECGTAVFDTSDGKPDTATRSPDLEVAVPFNYADLNFALGQEIRLVVLSPGEETDPIQCQIIHVNLKDCPDYEAVSYTWATESGDSTKSCKVWTEHHEFIEVTENCEKVLRRLRRPALKRRLWIDSICINQSNVKERNHQVSLMHMIYSDAANVQICIQDQSRYCSNFIRWLRASDNQKPSHAAFHGAKWLLRSRYFSRVWVIQEVALARFAFLVVGEESVLLSAQVLDRFRRMCSYSVPGVLQWNPGEKPKTDIITCLKSTADCSTTDIRDKVYAILSLLDPVSRSYIPVNYSSDLQSLMISVFTASIAYHRNLRILSYVRYSDEADGQWDDPVQFDLFRPYADSRHGTPRLLPSQFSREVDGPWRSQVRIERDLRSDTTDDESDTTHVSITRSSIQNKGYNVSLVPCIRVRAHYIDTIRDHGLATSLEIADSIRKDAFILGSAYLKWILRVFQRRCLPSSGNIFSLRPRLCSRMYGIGYSACERHCPIEEVTQSEAPGIDLKRLSSFLEEAASIREEKNALNIGGPSWILSTFYSIGVGPYSANVGDAIFAIDGAKSPFILRKVGERKYRIIGECYLFEALSLDCSMPPPGLQNQQPPTEYHYLQTQEIEIC